MKLYSDPGFRDLARAYSTEHHLEFSGCMENLKSLDEGYVLFLDQQGLSLCQTGKKAVGPIRCDFVAGSSRHRRLYGGGKSQTIARAMGIKDKVRPSVADLTAGLGADGFVLACLGCKVEMVERHPVVSALLKDGIARAHTAALEERDLSGILGRITLHQENAFQWLESLAEADQPDVIYLDPMFPERQKSAQVNKAMQAFQQLVGEDPDADELLPAALEKAVYRVVVKRPVRAPWLNNREPGYSLKGKSVRFDVYPLKAMTTTAS